MNIRAMAVVKATPEPASANRKNFVHQKTLSTKKLRPPKNFDYKKL
jgi:hypothetical protein